MTDEVKELAPQSQEGGFIGVINRLIDKGSVGADVLTKLFDMHREWEREQQRKAFVVAFSAFKADAPSSIERTGEVGYTSKKDPNQKVDYNHVELHHAAGILVPHMSKHGLAHSWETVQAETGMISVTCHLEHVGGFSRSVKLSAMPDPSGSKNPIQAIGSATYYLERYTFLAVLGVAQKGVDDDGQKTTAFITPEQIGEINTVLIALRELRGPEADFLAPLLCFAFEVDMENLDRSQHGLDKVPASKFKSVLKKIKDTLAIQKSKTGKDKS